MPVDWVGKAVFSSCKKYRYALVRTFSTWHLDGTCVFVMLNPSTATAETSDPTVRRCEGYARAWGHRALVVLNIFALRSTDPKALYKVEDPIGAHNDDYIEYHARGAEVVVCAWGIHGKHLGRGARVLEKLRPYNPSYLKMTKGGIPSHPLYLKANLKPKPVFSN